MILIKFANKQILLEAGLYQKNDYLESYKANTEKFKFKPEEIDYIFIGHCHIDHIGLIPRLVKEGFSGKIIMTYPTSIISKHLLLNCSFILSDEARVLSKRYSRDYAPIYSEDDVYNTFKLYTVYNQYDTLFQLDDIVSFQWLKNSHCVGAAQLQLILNDGVKKKKVLYTSDIGALETKNHYVENTEIPTYFNDVIIMESTYGLNTRISKKTREFDIEHLRIAIDTVLERHGTLVLPAFSFSRSQELLTTLFLLFGDDENFTTPIIVDSMLTCDICDDYGQVLQNDNLDLWNKVYNWKNVKYIREKSDSQSCVLDTTPKICISSSGFCTNGRVLSYLDRYLRDTNSMICFSGYVGDDESYLSYRIKNGKSHKTININKKPVPNRADCITMQSFSSHANFNDLLRYGSNLRTNQLVLVHGSIESKNCLKKHLKDEISRNDKTYKVTCSERDMIIPL
ncbi:MBL fold hydrolase [Enterocloster clostridioformis]|uniref:MBL fold hydrolase n=3 Tax=Enterocloster clostridioformis TaxID=1531 RepID=A0A829VZC4_9FIRM|nr:MBL fold hydrolase [Enterocloster clostridioformis]